MRNMDYEKSVLDSQPYNNQMKFKNKLNSVLVISENNKRSTYISIRHTGLRIQIYFQKVGARIINLCGHVNFFTMYSTLMAFCIMSCGIRTRTLVLFRFQLLTT